MKSRIYYGEYSLEHWMQLILKKKISLPEYQRLFVWKKEKTAKLIGSIENGEFIPPVTIGAYDDGENKQNLILDGQQRLTSVFLSYLGIFPNKEKYKKVIQRLADDDDRESEAEELDDILEWSFKKLLEKGNNKVEILSKIVEDNYDCIETVSEDFFKNHYLGFSYLVPQKESSEKEEDFYIEQQKYYSSVFRNINIQGEKLLEQESRKSLYFLNSKLVNFFEPKFANSIVVNKEYKMDFVKYLSLISHWIKKENINKVGYGYARKMESLYEEFIYFMAYESETESEIFSRVPSSINPEDCESVLSNIAEMLHTLYPEKTFDSIINIDVVAFGLLRLIIFDSSKIDISRKDEIILDLNRKINEFKEDVNHARNPSALRHLRNRMKTSYEIYRKYEK